MKKTESELNPEFRELSNEEMYGTGGGLCFLPTVLGQKLGKRLMDFLRLE
ncbi:hypothetical protein ACFLSP_00245 [Bacteroidota bacterium]